MVVLPDLQAGVWQHYKGPKYLVLGYGHDANYEGRDVVVYVGLELDEAKRGPRLAVRAVEDFLGRVHDDGTACVDDPGCGESTRARFTYLSPVY